MAVAKVVEIVSGSREGFQQAVEQCVAEAAKTIRGIVGVEVVGWTCKVDGDRIVEYRATCKIAFRVETDRA